MSAAPGPGRRGAGRPALGATRAPAVGSLAEIAYARLRRDVFEFRWLPGDRFNEKDLALSLGMSRTPVREALSRLAQEGHLSVSARSGWMVCPLDFTLYDELYETRIVLETAAVRRLCERGEPASLESLRRYWLAEPGRRDQDPARVAARDEAFHTALVEATGNRVMAQMHRDITDRIRIVRRLDFTDPARMDVTFDEHGQILRSIGRRKADQACLLLRAHVEASRAAVRRITLHRLYLAREGKGGITEAAAASGVASGERRRPIPRTGRRAGYAQVAVARL